MKKGGHRLTVGGRVNETQMTRIDAAARLTGLQRAHFVVGAVLSEADRVLQRAAGQGADDNHRRPASEREEVGSPNT